MTLLINLLRKTGFTQEEVGEMIGLTRSAITMRQKTSNVKIDIACIPDLRINVLTTSILEDASNSSRIPLKVTLGIPKVEALIKEKSKPFTERKTKKLDTSESAFSRQMDEIFSKKNK